MASRDLIQCSLCKQSFAAKKYLTRHAAAHSSARPFVCGLCEKSYKASKGLNRHIRARHPEQYREFAVYRQQVLKSEEMATSLPSTMIQYVQEWWFTPVPVPASKKGTELTLPTKNTHADTRSVTQKEQLSRVPCSSGEPELTKALRALCMSSLQSVCEYHSGDLTESTTSETASNTESIREETESEVCSKL